MIRPRYPVQELCLRHSFEEVAYLRWHGELPTQEQISAQNRAERAQRAGAWEIVAAIAQQPLPDHPLDTLRNAVTLLGVQDTASHDPAPAAIRAQALRLSAVVPAVIAMDQRLRNGLGVIAPRDHLSHAANFLNMTFGQVPEPQIVAAFEKSLILYTEHSGTAAPLATAGPDLYTTVTTAIDGLRDTPNASAGEAVLAMINEIAIPDNARPWLADAMAGARNIAGFGHDVQADADSRVPAMRAALGMIAALRGGENLLEIHDTIADAVYEAKGLRPSLDFPASLAYKLIGFDTPTFAPIVIAASLPSWTARFAHQLARQPG